MKALISGQVATAVLVDGEHFFSFDLDTPGETVRREVWEIPLLLADATDIQEIDNTSELAAIEELELAWTKDRTLQLILILLDSDEEAENRLNAAECLNEFLSNVTVNEYIANRLYSSPLPSDADIPYAIEVCSNASLREVREFLIVLKGDQQEISRRYNAWLRLPISLFGTPEDKDDFYFDAVRFGAFRMFATERERKNWALVQLLAHPYFRGKAKARAVFQAWAAPFKESATSPEFERKQTDKDLFEELEEEVRRERRGISPHEAFVQAEKQRDKIKQLLAEGEEELALRFVDQLVANQRRNSEPEHIAKSLCDLAQFAKKLGSPELQLEFARRAVGEAPTDAWSYSTLGDAYRALTEYQQALDAYHQAGVYGDRRAALLGRAEILKDLGQLANAMEVFDQLTNDYPGDIVILNARAAALADFGRLGASLNLYNEIIEEWLPEPVTLIGRAQVLKDAGRLDEALRELDTIVKTYVDEPVAQYTRAVVLRELGRMEEALQTFSELKTGFPLAAQFRASYARVLRDLGRYEEAIAVYNEIVKSHPFISFGHMGLADTFRIIGHLDRAHELYDLVIDRFPRVIPALNGKASLLMAQGHYNQAIKLLPSTFPATYNEWVSYHIRSMGYLRSGKLQRAENLLEKGLEDVPWATQKQYFKTALAGLRIQQKRFQDSIDLVRDVKNPSIEPIAQVLSMHAMGGLGDFSGMETAYKKVGAHSAPIVINLRDAIAAKYGRRTTQQSIWPDSQVFLLECDSLLLAA